MGTKVQRMDTKFGERLAGLEDRTCRIERAVQRFEEAKWKTEQKPGELMREIRALRRRPPPAASTSAPPQRPGPGT